MSQIEFKAPGPGSWELEQTHFARPATRYASALVSEPLARGFGEGTKRYGLLLDTLRMRFVNDFCYGKFVPVGAPDNASGPPPRPIFMLLTRLHPEIRRRIAAAPEVFAKKLWREDMRRWDEEIKPDSIARNRKLQNTPITTLGDAEFLAHLEDVRANAVEMIYRHHIFTIPCCFPVGHFVSEVQRWTGLPSGEVLGVLKGAAPISRGVGAAPLERLRAALAASGITADSVRGRPAQQVLDDLQSTQRRRRAAAGVSRRGRLPPRLGLRHRPTSTRSRCPRCWSAPSSAPRTRRIARETSRSAATRCARRCPRPTAPSSTSCSRKRASSTGCATNAGCTTTPGAPGWRGAPCSKPAADSRTAACCRTPRSRSTPSHDEIVGLLKGEKQPGVEELRRRQTWRETKTVADAPPFLGPEPKGPPPAEWLPKKAQANARAMDTVIREIFNVPAQKAPPRSVAGLPVHPGIYEGPARIVNGPQDFNRLQQGDVLVTRNTGPAFNVVLPLLGAIVTDRGGQLSHAAIVAREYGIPAVVGTREATTMFADGARVRVNGDKGVVELVEAGR